MSDPKPTRPPLEWWNEESASTAFCIETGEIQMWFRYTIHLEAELAEARRPPSIDLKFPCPECKTQYLHPIHGGLKCVHCGKQVVMYEPVFSRLMAAIGSLRAELAARPTVEAYAMVARRVGKRMIGRMWGLPKSVIGLDIGQMTNLLEDAIEECVNDPDELARTFKVSPQPKPEDADDH